MHKELSTAVQDFHQARRQATLQEMMARFTGKSTQPVIAREPSWSFWWTFTIFCA